MEDALDRRLVQFDGAVYLRRQVESQAQVGGPDVDAVETLGCDDRAAISAGNASGMASQALVAVAPERQRDLRVIKALSIVRVIG